MSEERVTITPLANGSLEITGPVTVTATDGTPIEVTDRTWLCRCGASEKKPFCDGSHKKIGFTSIVEPPTEG